MSDIKTLRKPTHGDYKELRSRLHAVFVHNPMSLVDLAQVIGISFNTIKKFLDPAEYYIQRVQLGKIEHYVLMIEKKMKE